MRPQYSRFNSNTAQLVAAVWLAKNKNDAPAAEGL